MPDLTLLPGPLLQRKTWHYEDTKKGGHWQPDDVTERAHEFLFHDVAVDPQVTLADLLTLVRGNPILLAVLRQNFSAELCEHALLGPVAPNEPAHERLEYLELYRVWGRNSSTLEYEGASKFHVHGMGVVQAHDIEEHGFLSCKKGERIQWSISMAPLHELLSLPIRIRTEVPVTEDDLDSKAYGDTLHTAHVSGITLGALLHEVLWELSWHGAPEAQQAVAQELREQVASLDADPVRETVPVEEFFVSMGFQPLARIFETYFVIKGLLEPAQISQALRELEDHEPAQEGLTNAFPGQLELRAPYQGLTGYALRKLVRLARETESPASS